MRVKEECWRVTEQSKEKEQRLRMVRGILTDGAASQERVLLLKCTCLIDQLVGPFKIVEPDLENKHWAKYESLRLLTS